MLMIIACARCTSASSAHCACTAVGRAAATAAAAHLPPRLQLLPGCAQPAPSTYLQHARSHLQPISSLPAARQTPPCVACAAGRATAPPPPTAPQPQPFSRRRAATMTVTDLSAHPYFPLDLHLPDYVPLQVDFDYILVRRGEPGGGCQPLGGRVRGTEPAGRWEPAAADAPLPNDGTPERRLPSPAPRSTAGRVLHRRAAGGCGHLVAVRWAGAQVSGCRQLHAAARLSTHRPTRSWLSARPSQPPTPRVQAGTSTWAPRSACCAAGSWSRGSSTL